MDPANVADILLEARGMAQMVGGGGGGGGGVGGGGGGGQTQALIRKVLDAIFITNITTVHIHLA